VEILLAYLAAASLIAALAGLVFPKRLVFWCAPDDRSRAMAFTVYLTLTIVLPVTFIAVVPEPEPTPKPAPPVAKAPAKPPVLTRQLFWKEVEHRLVKLTDFPMKKTELSLLTFDRTGATVQIFFPEKPHRKLAVDSAKLMIEAMIETFKAHKWNIADPFLVMCQVHTLDPVSGLGRTVHFTMGFARYMPDDKTIMWLDFD